MKILKFDTTKHNIYFTSDLHLGHKSIIKFCKRPFTYEQQNETIINNYNKIIKDDDIVFILGDIFWKSNKENLEWFKKLKGKKYIIKGNHDCSNIISKIDKYVEGVYPALEIEIDKQKIYLSHYKIIDCPNSIINIHGHLHSKSKNIVDRKTYDCGIDGNNYKPVHYSYIINKIKNYKQPIWKRIWRKITKRFR